MRVWAVAAWGANWLCPSVEAVDSVINAIIPYGLKDFAKNARRLREVPAVQHDSY